LAKVFFSLIANGTFFTPQTEQNEALFGKLVELNWYYLIVYLNLTADSNSYSI